VGIGQGYLLTTPLQLAAAVATLANDGVPVHPHLLKAVQDSKTQERQRHHRDGGRGSSSIKPEHLALGARRHGGRDASRAAPRPAAPAPTPVHDRREDRAPRR
jgi:membrane carboxypeptidase/penicillin-binding protein